MIVIRKRLAKNKRYRRKLRIRKKVKGTPEQPRLSVFRSAKHIYAQVIDDSTGKTLVSESTINKTFRNLGHDKKKVEQAEIIGEAIAKRCLEDNITKVVFDRNGFKFHGRVKALADGARKGGLKF